MIDVVFLLIVFFLVSSHLASREVQVDLQLPDAASGRRPFARPADRITINVLAGGQIVLAGTPVGKDELARRLAFEATRTGPDLEVGVRSDRRVPYRIIESILVACARAGIWNVGFAVRAEGG
jgi:biopolymer transport protein ExbD